VTHIDIRDEISESMNGCTRLGLQLSGQIGKVSNDGHCGVFIAGILADSAASKNADIRVGDQLLQVKLNKRGAVAEWLAR